MYRYFKMNDNILWRKDNGAVLIEVLLAVVILASSLTLIIRSLVMSLRATVYSRDYSQAVFLLDNKLGEIVQRRFLEDSYQEEGGFPEPFEKYRYEITAQNILEEEPSGGVSEVNVLVSWESGKNERKISADTYLLHLPPVEEL